ncbi:CoA-binding protein [Actinocatenispora rupis]|uniref:CoA-binding protein n=1 Tax=Actinocatenispora rupis TaxID=519421 RepID=A0A8J3J836_9ACTN|nr:CoA-binding protein [Actinocatenispora rupis]GID11877.1 CoA-binding protein [Actinocatenispora rupis]
MNYRDPATIDRVLAHDTWAIVGLTDNPHRTAYRIGRFLLDRGKRIIPVNPRAEAVHGSPGYASLADIPGPVDVVDIFRRSEQAGVHVDEAVTIGARAVWLQLGVIDEAAAERAAAAGLDVVMDTCPAIEWH